MKSLLPYLKPFKKQCVIGPLCKWIEAILELILPTIMAFMIDQGVMKSDMRIVFTYGSLMILMVFIGFGFSLVCQYQAAIASQGFGTNMRNLLLEKILSLSYEDLDRFGEATLINRISNDVNQLQVAVAMLIRLVIRAPFIVLGAVLMAMFLDFQLSLILIATIPLIALTLYVFLYVTTPLYSAYQEKLDDFTHLLEQNFAGVRVIRAFLSQRKESARLMEISQDLKNRMMRIARISSLLQPFHALIVNGAIVILLWNGWIALPDGIPAGTMVAFINYATQILLALVAVSNLIVIFTRANASAKRVNELLACETKEHYGCVTAIKDSSTAIVFSNVSFTYPFGKRPALRNLSLEIQAGETIGVIGGTGSGKSTLASILMRSYPCDQITIFGQPIASYDPSTFASLVTLIPQKSELFSGTLKENLHVADASANDDALWSVLQKAQAKDFVSEKDGLHMRIEAQGKNLSGGQKQRICIARGLLRKSRILIFDDAFSALDFQTDAQIRNAIAKESDCTKILISQRVATLLNCDRILVLDDGAVAGFAPHKELFDSCVTYREICVSQAIGRQGVSAC